MKYNYYLQAPTYGNPGSEQNSPTKFERKKKEDNLK